MISFQCNDGHEWNEFKQMWSFELCQNNKNCKFVRLYSGTYFGTHFIMGGERFDTPQPEAYLFGENGDLNFLGSRPTAVGISVQC